MLGTGRVMHYCYFLGYVTDSKMDCEIFHLMTGILNYKKKIRVYLKSNELFSQDLAA